MSGDKKDDIAKQDDPSVEDAKKTEAATSEAGKSTDDQELDEGLDESMSGSDAPSATRRG